MCKRCILDESIADLIVDDYGECNYCKIHDELDKEYPLNKKGKKLFDILINQIIDKGKNSKYDCIVGVSGGRDSTFALYKAVELGLRPLAVHFDNGWNSAIAVTNIKKQLDILNIDLYTYVVNWEEFKDLQISIPKSLNIRC